MATSTTAMVSQLRALSREYKAVYNRLIALSKQFRAGMPSTPFEVLIPDSEIIDRIREAGDSASVAVHRTLETSVWLNAAADALVEKAKEEKRKKTG